MKQQGNRLMSDILIIGGGVNGCGIARDAAGRGLTVTLVEMGDLGSATSSASTKLFHGGLRYLEYFDVSLVRHSLQEREVLLKAMPHISWPLRFVLPIDPEMRFDSSTPLARVLNTLMPWQKNQRPAWMIRFGLFLYDHLGGRDILPATSNIDLTTTPEGAVLQDRFKKAFEYSDCWVDDARLVMLNARNARAKGARILTQSRVIRADRKPDHWSVTIRNTKTGQEHVTRARVLVNAGGPWVNEILLDRLHMPTPENLRLVRGSHIVTKRLYAHDKCYFFQGSDGRIVFAIPYEEDFTLIGTTDVAHDDPSIPPVSSEGEKTYLIGLANQYFRQNLTVDDIVWTYSGVRPLLDDGASAASATTRDYTLRLNEVDGAPILSVFGGKITTYRRLAQDALGLLSEVFPEMIPDWTRDAPLPGGDFAVTGVADLTQKLLSRYAFLDPPWARRLTRSYGTEAFDMLGDARDRGELGEDFGATLHAREVVWMMDQEFARTAEDVIWRRSKLGLRLSASQIDDLAQWMQDRAVSVSNTAQEGSA